MSDERRFDELPERIRFEDMTTTQPVEPAADGTPEDADLERYWAAHLGG